MKFMPSEIKPTYWVAYRLGECPRGGGWCTSSCSYNQHASPWKVIAEDLDPDRFVAELEGALDPSSGPRPQNHNISISGYLSSGKRFADWVWITFGEDLEDVDAIYKFTRSVRRLIKMNHRLRLYGDETREATA